MSQLQPVGSQRSVCYRGALYQFRQYHSSFCSRENPASAVEGLAEVAYAAARDLYSQAGKSTSMFVISQKSLLQVSNTVLLADQKYDVLVRRWVSRDGACRATARQMIPDAVVAEDVAARSEDGGTVGDFA